MKKISVVMLLCAALFGFAGAACAAENPALPHIDMPMLINPFGQSQDANFVNLLAKRSKLNSAYELYIFAKDVDWSKYKTLVVVLGGSGKGLGAAGLDVPGEVARCNGLIAEAKKNGVYIVGMHIGGADRRGPNSEAFLPYAGMVDYMVVRADGNEDGYFTKLCGEKKIPLYTIQKTSDLRSALAEMTK